MGKEKGPITIHILLFLVHCFEETGSLCVRRDASSFQKPVPSQMNTLSEQSTRGGGVRSTKEVQRITDIPKTSVFRIILGVLKVCPYKLQSLHRMIQLSQRNFQGKL